MSAIHDALRATLSIGARALLDGLAARGDGTYDVYELVRATDIRALRIPSLLDELAEQGAITVQPVAPDTFALAIT